MYQSGDHMRDEQVLIMAEKEYEMAELLRKLNVSRPVAMALACLSNREEVTSREIEMISGLRQPEVSIAMRYLSESEWIDIREEKKTEGKGRPIKLYRLVVELENIIKNIEDDFLSQSKSMFESIERLKHLS